MPDKSKKAPINHITAYTDGSADSTQQSAAAGLVVVNGKESKVMHMNCQYLKMANSYEGEVYGIKMAVEWFRKSEYYLNKRKRINKLLIKCDNKGAVSMFNKLKRTQKLDKEAKAQFLWKSLMGKTDRVDIKWVKAHNGNPYNEVADYLARSCREKVEATYEKE